MTDKPHRTSEQRRDTILSMIRDNPGNLGPKQIAEAIGSTPKAVAVTICHLRADGYRISLCTPGRPVTEGAGYRYHEERKSNADRG
jgi:predicted transcriptional regulator